MAYTPFKMKGHTLPGIKQDPSKKTADGRAGSSPFQQKTESFNKYTKSIITGAQEGIGEKADLFLKGKTKDKEGNIKDINWAPPPPVREGFKKTSKKKSPTKLAFLAALPAIAKVAGAVGAVAGAAKNVKDATKE